MRGGGDRVRERKEGWRRREGGGMDGEEEGRGKGEGGGGIGGKRERGKEERRGNSDLVNRIRISTW